MKTRGRVNPSNWCRTELPSGKPDGSADGNARSADLRKRPLPRGRTSTSRGRIASHHRRKHGPPPPCKAPRRQRRSVLRVGWRGFCASSPITPKENDRIARSGQLPTIRKSQWLPSKMGLDQGKEGTKPRCMLLSLSDIWETFGPRHAYPVCWSE